MGHVVIAIREQHAWAARLLIVEDSVVAHKGHVTCCHCLACCLKHAVKQNAYPRHDKAALMQCSPKNAHREPSVHACQRQQGMVRSVVPVHQLDYP